MTEISLSGIQITRTIVDPWEEKFFNISTWAHVSSDAVICDQVTEIDGIGVALHPLVRDNLTLFTYLFFLL